MDLFGSSILHAICKYLLVNTISLVRVTRLKLIYYPLSQIHGLPTVTFNKSHRTNWVSSASDLDWLFDWYYLRSELAPPACLTTTSLSHYLVTIETLIYCTRIGLVLSKNKITLFHTYFIPLEQTQKGTT